MESFQLSDLNVTTFNKANATTKIAFERFVRGLTIELDNEPGDEPEKGTWVWMKEQDAVMSAYKPFATFILTDKNSGAVQATASFVQDDRGVAKEKGFDQNEEFLGIWGGFVVQRDIRQHGLGTVISKYVDDHVQAYVDSIGKPKLVYLFTANEHAMKIYERLGFKRTDESVDLPEFGFEEVLFVKRYEPRKAGIAVRAIEFIDADQLPKAIARGKQPLVLVVGRHGCPGCDMLAPVMQNLAAEFGDKLQFRKMDSRQNQKFVRAHGFNSVPHLMFFNEEQLVCETGDFADEAEVRDWVETFAFEHAGVTPA
jgi:thioredoxin 1